MLQWCVRELPRHLSASLTVIFVCLKVHDIVLLAQGEAAAPAAPVVAEVIKEQVQQILGGQTLEQYQQDWGASNSSSSLKHAAAADRTHTLLHQDQQQPAAETLLERATAIGRLHTHAYCKALGRTHAASVLRNTCCVSILTVDATAHVPHRKLSTSTAVPCHGLQPR